MKFVTSKQKDGAETKIYYQDIGSGKPVILLHGWPLDHQMWDYQVSALNEAGYRVIAPDRRGFGKSDAPLNGYDYDTFTADLKVVIDEEQLNDFAIVGFSMGGGEVVKYFANYGGKGANKAVLISSIAPYFLQTDDNPDGVPQEMVDEIVENLNKDRAAFLGDFGKQFYGVSLISNPVSEQVLTNDLIIAMQSTLNATLKAADSFAHTDLRPDMKSINVPLLVIHGDADKTVPIKATGEQAAAMVDGAEFLIYEGEPHGLFLTSKDQLNADLIDFLGR